MTNSDKHEAIKNELLKYGKDYKKQGHNEISETFRDTASLIESLTQIYKRNNYSITEVIILRTRINHNFNHLQRAMTKKYNDKHDANKINSTLKTVLNSFHNYYDFFQFENKNGTA